MGASLASGGGLLEVGVSARVWCGFLPCVLTLMAHAVREHRGINAPFFPCRFR